MRAGQDQRVTQPSVYQAAPVMAYEWVPIQNWQRDDADAHRGARNDVDDGSTNEDYEIRPMELTIDQN